ncbi:zinc finger, CCHC-type containing protein [Tanacetum coccineum]|uniref:Zinc finger, CCHC-type containing protein n=1 Tax=Tanacetum coccineum TaxID=301880 RepID=A0ABQ5HK87_9ASTR
MHFLLFSMSMVYVLTTPMPEDGGDNPNVDQVMRRAKWDNDDYVYRGLILNVVNMVEHNNSSRYNDNMGKRKHHNTKADPNKKPKVTCWKCGKPGYLKKDCKAGNVGNKANGSGTKGSMDGSSNLLKGQNLFNKSLQVDSGATVHVCKDRCWFKTYESLNDGSILRMGNESTVLMHGGGCVDLRAESRVLRAVVRLPDPKLKTLGERGIECIFVGYDEHSKAFRFYVIEPNDSVAINSIIKLRDAIFDEHSGSVVPEKVTDEVVQQPELELRKSKRHRLQTSGLQMDLQKKAEVARISTIRLLIAMASIHNLIIHQMDVKTAFLNGKLEKEAPKQWHQNFDEVVLSNGYLLNQADKCVYRKIDESGKEVIICLYVDDMLIFGTDQVLDLTKEFLSSRFSMKDIEEADVILGIRIKHESNGIEISQSYYIEKVLKKFNHFDCTLVSTLMDTIEKLIPNNGQAVSQLEYSRVIGCLMYAMTCWMVTSSPGTQHWQAIQWVLKYLKKTMDYRLIYTGYPLVLEGYTDASWISNTEDNLSISGWVFLLGGGAISWASKNQTCITGSTMESEFEALAAAGKEAEWLKNLLLEIPLWIKPIAPISIRCDSATTLAKAYS